MVTSNPGRLMVDGAGAVVNCDSAEVIDDPRAALVVVNGNRSAADADGRGGSREFCLALVAQLASDKTQRSLGAVG